MKNNNYSVKIIGGTEKANQYVHMKNKQVYKLELHNGTWERCNAVVEIDGKEVGTWRMNAQTTCQLERPVGDMGKFTFYSKKSKEGKMAQLDSINKNDLGLVKVIFIPEQKPVTYYPQPYIIYTNTVPIGPKYEPYVWSVGNNLRTAGGGGKYQANINTLEMQFTSNIEAGGTGLSGESYQEYSLTGAMSLDYSRSAVIALRLVTEKNSKEPKYLGPRPLGATKSTRIPAPVG